MASDKILYHFDAVVPRMEVPGQCFEEKDKVQVQLNFFKRACPIISGDRLNAVRFKHKEPLCEFAVEPICLREYLMCNGVTFVLKYGNKPIGCGNMPISESVGNEILKMTPNMELIQSGEVELVKGSCTTGLIGVRFRLQALCPPEPTCKPPKSRSTFAPCQPAQQNGSLVGQQENLQNSSLEKLQKKLDELDSRTKKAKRCPKYPSSSKSSSSKVDDYNYEIQTPAQKIPPAFGDDLVNLMCPKISAPVLKHTYFKTPRSCPVCKKGAGWLPKFSACAYCGYKPMPVVKEKPYDEAATAKDIILQQLEMPPDDASCQFSIKCSSTSEGEASNEDFETLIKNFNLLKETVQKGNEKPRDSSQRDEKPQSSEAHQSSKLVDVFSELKSLFTNPKSKTSEQETAMDIPKIAQRLSRSSRMSAKLISSAEKQTPAKPPAKRKVKRRYKQIKSKVYTEVEARRISKTHLGHQTCVNGYAGGRKNVPSHMGWLWTSSAMASRPGWKPGAIRKSTRQLMSYFLTDFPVDSIPVSKYMSYHKGKKPAASPRPNTEHTSDLVQHPTLHVLKKNDEVIITLRPLKKADDLAKCANPYIDMKPVRFRIVKNAKLKQGRELKRTLKEMGFSKCTCHLPVVDCYCRSFLDKKRLLYEVSKECSKRKMEHCEETLVLTDTTESEAEFDFAVTPPAGIVKPERLKVADTVNCETQYDENDWAMPTMYPHPPNALVQYCNCAMGERKDRFKWIFGKGNINKEEKKPNAKKTKNPKKRLKGGGATVYASSSSEDLSEEARHRDGFESKAAGTNSKPLPSVLSRRLAGRANTPKYCKDNINNSRPQAEMRLQRLVRASIPPAARSVGGTEKQIKASRDTFTPKAEATNCRQKPTRQVLSKPAAAGHQATNKTANCTETSLSAAMHKAGHDDLNRQATIATKQTANPAPLIEPRHRSSSKSRTPIEQHLNRVSFRKMSRSVVGLPNALRPRHLTRSTL